MFSMNAQLKVGQCVNLECLENGYQITVLLREQPGPRIAEVGADYLILDDTAPGVRTRIPAYIIKSVVVPSEGTQQAA